MLKKYSWALLPLLFLGACENDEDGNLTFIKGEISGTLRNGQILKETFMFSYPGGGFEQFETNYLGQPQITLRRTNDSGGSFMDIGLVLSDPSYPMDSLRFTSVTDGAYQFALQKEVDAQTLLEVSCLGFKYMTGLRSLSLSANKEYQFVTDPQGNPTYNLVATPQSPPENSVCCPNNHCCIPVSKYDYKFPNSLGDTIYYSRYGETLNEFPWKAPFSKIVSSAGIESSVSELYSKLKFGRISVSETFYEVQEPYDRSLMETYDILGEKGVISNLVYNETTGHLSFDFLIRASGSNASNSTGHDLEITGSFNSGNVKLYKVLN